ncbi:MAG: hypothetical protein AB1916_08430 [Thermodesulfobacteriota bacterium]
MSDDFQSVLADVAEAMQFETWLRFYFLKEAEGGTLRMDIPDEAAEAIRRDHAPLWPLAEALNGKTVDYQTSLTEVCTFAARYLDGVRHRAGLVDKVFDSRDFKVEMHLFALFLSGHEAAFDQERLGFAQWREIFAQWKASDQVRDYLAKAAAPGENASDACKTMQ